MVYMRLVANMMWCDGGNNSIDSRTSTADGAVAMAAVIQSARPWIMLYGEYVCVYARAHI